MKEAVEKLKALVQQLENLRDELNERAEAVQEQLNAVSEVLNELSSKTDKLDLLLVYETDDVIEAIKALEREVSIQFPEDPEGGDR